jgi:hypothetical protein
MQQNFLPVHPCAIKRSLLNLEMNFQDEFDANEFLVGPFEKHQEESSPPRAITQVFDVPMELQLLTHLPPKSLSSSVSVVDILMAF